MRKCGLHTLLHSEHHDVYNRVLKSATIFFSLQHLNICFFHVRDIPAINVGRGGDVMGWKPITIWGEGGWQYILIWGGGWFRGISMFVERGSTGLYFELRGNRYNFDREGCTKIIRDNEPFPRVCT